MKIIKFSVSWIVLLSWLFTSGFQTIPQGASFDRSLSLSSPAAPADFVKTAPNRTLLQPTTGVTLAWSASSANVTYQYCLRSQKTSCPNPKWVSVGKDTSAALGTLSANTTYYWQVRAVDASKNITYADGGAWWSFKTGVGSPAAFGKAGPANSAANQPVSLTLSWGASAGTSVSYEYCYSSLLSDCSGSSWTGYHITTATSASISGLNYAVPYYWQVRAKNAGGTYTYADGGSVWSFTTRIAPPAPFAKQSPTQSATSVPLSPKLEWSPSTDAASYSYCIDTLDNGTCDAGEISVGSNTSVTLPTLTYNTQYYWQVFAANSTDKIAADNGTWRNFTTLVSPPSSFTKINPSSGAQNQSLTPWLDWWTPSSAGNTYAYCWSTTNGTCTNGWTPVAENAPIHITSGLANNTAYYWQVRATNGGGETFANGAWWSFTTLKTGPSSSSQPFSMAEDATLNAQLTAISNYSKLFSLVGGLPAGTLDFHSDGSFAYTPPANFNGQMTFQFDVQDGYNPPAGPYTATITVTSVNDAPVLDAIPSQVVAAGDLLIFVVSAADDADAPYGDTLTYSVIEALPAGASLNTQFGVGVFSWIAPASLTPGNYTFTFKVTDSGTPALSDTQTVSIVVIPGIPVTGDYEISIPFVAR